jgi:nucleoid-associated protein YgaU
MQENRTNPEEGNRTPDQSADNTHGIITEYITEEKDTLPDIAKRYGLSIEDIIAANPDIGEPADLVQPGQRIMIPRK